MFEWIRTSSVTLGFAYQLLIFWLNLFLSFDSRPMPSLWREWYACVLQRIRMRCAVWSHSIRLSVQMELPHCLRNMSFFGRFFRSIQSRIIIIFLWIQQMELVIWHAEYSVTFTDRLLISISISDFSRANSLQFTLASLIVQFVSFYFNVK